MKNRTRARGAVLARQSRRALAVKTRSCIELGTCFSETASDPGYIDEPVARFDGTGAAIYFSRNQQYSITAVTDGSGTIVERYAYGAYGTPTITNASGSPISNQQSSINNRFTYTGREWDEAFALYHYRARMYDSVGGRFVSRDPIGFHSGSKNTYQAVNGKPLVFVDPSGMLEYLPPTDEKMGRPDGPLHGDEPDGPYDPTDPFGLFPPFPDFPFYPPPYVPEVDWYPEFEFPIDDRPKIEHEQKFPKIEIPQRGWYPRCKPGDFEFDLKKRRIKRIGIDLEWEF